MATPVLPRMRDGKGRYLPNSASPLSMSKLRVLAMSLSTPASSPALRGAATDFVATLKRLLSQPGRGEEYPRGRKVHRASQENDPPAVDTGRLRNSAGMEVGPVSIRVGVGAEYGEHLEFGTTHMGPRPFMRPTKEAILQRWRGQRIAAVLRGHTGKVLRGD